MGYTTEFEGSFRLNRKLKAEHFNYLKEFSATRRVKRDAKITEKFEDPIRKKVGLPVGIEGEFFVGKTVGKDNGIISNGQPPKTQPGLYCQWVPTSDGKGIEWDGGEKFYEYEKWLVYIINNFLIKWGYTLNGKVSLTGEDETKSGGAIKVVNNKVTIEKKDSKLASYLKKE